MPDLLTLLQHATVEATPKGASQMAEDRDFFSTALPSRSHVFNTAFGTSDSLVSSVRSTVANGFNPVPHIAARRFRSVAHLNRTLSQLRAVCGDSLWDTVLVLGGERDEDEEEASAAAALPDAMAVLKTGLLQVYGIKHILVAGHPEGIMGMSPSSCSGSNAGAAETAAVLFAALQKKCDYTRAHGLSFGIVTQLCLSSTALCSWLADLRSIEGLEGVPVHIGVAGPARIETVERFADTLCGVRVPQPHENGSLLVPLSPPDSKDLDCVAMLSDIAERCPSDAIQSIHIYAFGGLRRTCRWLHEQRGRMGISPQCKL